MRKSKEKEMKFNQKNCQNFDFSKKNMCTDISLKDFAKKSPQIMVIMGNLFSLLNFVNVL